MRKTLLIAFCIILPWSAAFAAKVARLQYLPNVPVYLSSRVGIDISQSFPGLSLATKGKQNIEAILSVKGDQSTPPIIQAPFDLTLVLKSIKIDLHANDEDISFDSNEMASTLYLSQVSKIIDRPIQIHFGSGFEFEGSSEELLQVVNALPVFQEVNLENLLVELFLHLFALGGQELSEGQTIKKKLGNYGIPSIPSVVEYSITSIDDYNVYADIGGKIEKQKFQLNSLVQVNDKLKEIVGGTLSGTMHGKVKWNRDNAMLYELEMAYAYSAMFKLGEWEWMMNVALEVHNRTKMRPGP